MWRENPYNLFQVGSDHHFYQFIHSMSFTADTTCRETYRSVTDSLALLTKGVILLVAPKEVKAWTIGRPRTPLNSICSLKTQKWAVTQWASTHISLEHEWHVVFAIPIYQRTKSFADKEPQEHLSLCMQFDQEPTLYSMNTTASENPFWSLPTGHCRAGMVLELGHPWGSLLQAQTLYQEHIFAEWPVSHSPVVQFVPR